MAIYLDYNATTPLRPAARDAMMAALGEVGNPSSVHSAGRGCRDRLERAREEIAQFCGVSARRLVFTSGATEANHLALMGLHRIGEARPTRVLVSAVEHESVLATVPQAESLPVDSQGLVDLAALAVALSRMSDSGPALVSVMAVNNETGVVQPLAAIAALVRTAGGLLHVDAAQALGKLPSQMWQGADALSVSAHKIGGPAGIGALGLGSGVDVTPQMRGGGQELGRRAGTVNSVGAVGFAAALVANAADSDWGARVAALRDQLQTALADAGGVIVAGDAPRVPGALAVAMPGVSAAMQVMALDLAGFAVSAGSACSSGKVKESHVLRAMGLDALAGCTVRVSLGWETTPDEVAQFAEAWRAVRGRLGS